MRTGFTPRSVREVQHVADPRASPGETSLAEEVGVLPAFCLPPSPPPLPVCFFPSISIRFPCKTNISLPLVLSGSQTPLRVCSAPARELSSIRLAIYRSISTAVAPAIYLSTRRSKRTRRCSQNFFLLRRRTRREIVSTFGYSSVSRDQLINSRYQRH